MGGRGGWLAGWLGGSLAGRGGGCACRWVDGQGCVPALLPACPLTCPILSQLASACLCQPTHTSACGLPPACSAHPGCAHPLATISLFLTRLKPRFTVVVSCAFPTPVLRPSNAAWGASTCWLAQRPPEGLPPASSLVPMACPHAHLCLSAPCLVTPPAVIGRSNVGKSSLINMLTGRNSLAMVSKTPGGAGTAWVGWGWQASKHARMQASKHASKQLAQAQADAISWAALCNTANSCGDRPGFWQRARPE